MEKLNVETMQSIQGGGCMKWARRASRESDEDVKAHLLKAFDACIADMY